jgi:hypothetical protein
VAYRTSLRSFPNDGWALHGLAVALDRQGKTAEAASVAAAFEAAWAKADVKLKASRF